MRRRLDVPRCFEVTTATATDLPLFLLTASLIWMCWIRIWRDFLNGQTNTLDGVRIGSVFVGSDLWLLETLQGF